MVVKMSGLECGEECPLLTGVGSGKTGEPVPLISIMVSSMTDEQI